MNEKRKFDAMKCAKCKFHGTIGSRDKSKHNNNISCDYAALAHNGTCLKRINGGTVDRRGEDFYNCKLFQKGKSLAKEKTKITF